MKFANAHLRTKAKLFALGAILASVAAAAVIFGVANTGAASSFEDVAVNQVIERGGVAVTLDGLRLGEDETQLTYSYSAPMWEQVEPLGLPRIDLPDGSQWESKGGGAFDGGTNSGTRTFKLPPIPEDVETISVDLASFITYTPGAKSVEIPLGDLLEKVDLMEINEREELPLGVGFSIGPARYRITSLLLDPESFILVCEPVNDAASRTTLGAQPSSVKLTDDKGQTYSSFLIGAGWDPADNGGYVMTHQGLYFDGLPRSDTTAFSLHLGGKGEIKAPFVFRIDIPQAGEAD